MVGKQEAGVGVRVSLLLSLRCLLPSFLPQGRGPHVVPWLPVLALPGLPSMLTNPKVELPNPSHSC